MKIPLSQITLPDEDLRASVDEESLDELADSLRDSGQLQPIGVKQLSKTQYEVVFGARRTRAALLLGWTEIRAEICEADSRTNPEAQKLIENVQREDLTPIEEAYGLKALIGDAEIDIRRLQKQTSKSRPWIIGRLELLDLPPDLQGLVQTKKLSIAVIKALSQIADIPTRDRFIQHAIDHGCTEATAKIWASQAAYAETGITTADDLERMKEEATQRPQPAEILYSCFGCSNRHRPGEINFLAICGRCQTAIPTVHRNGNHNTE